MAEASHDRESDLMSNGQGDMGLPNNELYDKTHHLGELSKRLPRYPNARSQIPSTVKAGGTHISALANIHEILLGVLLQTG